VATSNVRDLASPRVDNPAAQCDCPRPEVVDDLTGHHVACVYSFQADSRGNGFGFGADGTPSAADRVSPRQAEAVISNLFANHRRSGDADPRGHTQLPPTWRGTG
jgi:hypothetical protein